MEIEGDKVKQMASAFPVGLFLYGGGGKAGIGPKPELGRAIIGIFALQGRTWMGIALNSPRAGLSFGPVGPDGVFSASQQMADVGAVPPDQDDHHDQNRCNIDGRQAEQPDVQRGQRSGG